jgi:hypothetical protein
MLVLIAAVTLAHLDKGEYKLFWMCTSYWLTLSLTAGDLAPQSTHTLSLRPMRSRHKLPKTAPRLSALPPTALPRERLLLDRLTQPLCSSQQTVAKATSLSKATLGTGTTWIRGTQGRTCRLRFAVNIANLIPETTSSKRSLLSIRTSLSSVSWESE